MQYELKFILEGDISVTHDTNASLDQITQKVEEAMQYGNPFVLVAGDVLIVNMDKVLVVEINALTQDFDTEEVSD